jgi:hypothetical protein
VLNPLPPPVILTCEIVRVAFPPFEILIGCEFVLPVPTLPKLTLDGVAAISAWAPVPLTATTVGEPGALSAIETLPETAPEAAGANCTSIVVFAPALSVCGKTPFTVIPAPVAVAPDIEIIALLEFVIVIFCELLPPTLMLPKLTDNGATVRPGCVPMPVREMEAGEFEASLVTVNIPFAAPVACGANCICTVTLCPTATDPDGLAPTKVNPAPEIVACEMFTAAVPVLVRLTLCAVVVLPTASFPKLTPPELALKTPLLGSCVVTGAAELV